MPPPPPPQQCQPLKWSPQHLEWPVVTVYGGGKSSIWTAFPLQATPLPVSGVLMGQVPLLDSLWLSNAYRESFEGPPGHGAPFRGAPTRTRPFLTLSHLKRTIGLSDKPVPSSARTLSDRRQADDLSFLVGPLER